MKIMLKKPAIFPFVISTVIFVLFLLVSVFSYDYCPWFAGVIDSGNAMGNNFYFVGVLVGAVASLFLEWGIFVLYTLFSCFKLELSGKEVQHEEE